MKPRETNYSKGDAHREDVNRFEAGYKDIYKERKPFGKFRKVYK